VEELARVCASTALTILISRLATIPILNWGSDELKRRYVPRIASGESQGSYCLSEPEAGSDVASMKARAVRDGDHYVLSGMKSWITNAGVSDIHIVFAKTAPDAGSSGVSCFVVERDFGLNIGKLEDKLGVRARGSGDGAHRRGRGQRRPGEGRGDGQVLRVRHGDGGHDRRHPAPRRLRLCQGLPDGALLPGRQGHPDLRGNQPGPAGGDR